MLSFYTKEEAGSEAVDVCNARCPCFVVILNETIKKKKSQRETPNSDNRNLYLEKLRLSVLFVKHVFKIEQSTLYNYYTNISAKKSENKKH